MAEIISTVPEVPVISNTPYTAPVTPSTAAQTLNTYGINPNDVLSAGNIQQTINAPEPAPDDLLGIRNQLYQQGGVTTAQQASQAAQTAASQATLGLSQRLTGLSGRAVSMSKITGTQAQEREVSQGEIDALNESARLAANDYAAKKGNADEMFQIRNQEISEKKAVMLQYPGAKIGFGDSFADVTKKLTKYEDQQKKDTYKATLKAKAMELGLKTKGSAKDLEKRISKSSKAALKSIKDEHDLKMESLRMDIANTKSTIANRGSSSENEDALLELKKKTMEQDLKVSEQDYNYKQSQIDEANNPNYNFWDTLSGNNPGASLNPLSWF